MVLRQLRDNAQLSRAELAAECDVDQSTIWYLEHGRRRARDGLLYRLAKVLGADVAVLRDTMPQPPRQKRHIKADGAA